jgi:hypothetical protein
MEYGFFKKDAMPLALCAMRALKNGQLFYG